MRTKFISALAFAWLVTGFALAQDQTVQNSSNIGMPPNGVFSGSDFESVQLQNGNLHIDIPIWSQKGRGLGTGAKFIYDSLGWTSSPLHCNRLSGLCDDHIVQTPDNNLILAVTSPFAYSASGGQKPGEPGCTQYFQYRNYTLREPDGTKHHFLPDPAYVGGSTGAACGGPLGKMYADDGSGWILNVQPQSPGLPLSAISKGGLKVNFSAGTIEDSNGNALNGSTSTDTLGRTVYTDGSYVDSSGTHQLLNVTTESVTIQTNLCPLLGADTCGEYSNTWTVPHIITLPNGMTYTIEYVQGQYGQPSSMTLPTGGQISWTWYQPSGTKTTLGPMVQQRTLTANGTSGTWQYSNESGFSSVTVTDPAGNQTVTAFTCPSGRYVDESANNGDVDPPCYVTSVKYYNGSSASGTLLKTVATTYTPSGAVLPQTVTTTLNDANLVSKTYTTYDSIPIPLWTGDNFTWGNPTEQDEYDYGTGAAGALLRKTTTNYLHLINSTYQTANIADRPTLKVTYDGSGNTVAQEQRLYDYSGSSYMVADLGGAPNHDAGYTTSYLTRGNASIVQRWLNPGNTWIGTTNKFDDLGNVITTTDPGGHTTAFSYGNNFANWNCLVVNSAPQAFVFQATNALGQNAQTAYYGCTGLPVWKRDQNDINAGRFGTSFAYDLMNRPLTVSYEDGGQTTYVYDSSIAGNIYTYRTDLICNSSNSATCPPAKRRRHKFGRSLTGWAA